MWHVSEGTEGASQAPGLGISYLGKVLTRKGMGGMKEWIKFDIIDFEVPVEHLSRSIVYYVVRSHLILELGSQISV